MSSIVSDRFVVRTPFAVMTRILTQDFIGNHLNTVCYEHREKQYQYLATFKSVAAAVTDVTLNSN
jgi:hypothetical protein